MIITECITLFSDILEELEFEIKQLRLKEWNWLPQKIYLVWLLEKTVRFVGLSNGLQTSLEP